MAEPLIMSTLPKTWIFDLDGTLVEHNGYRTQEGDRLLPGVKEYLDRIPPDDMILILTARKEEFRTITLAFLKESGLRYDHILFDMPVGERIVVNDRKPSGLDMALALNTDRNQFDLPRVVCKL